MPVSVSVSGRCGGAGGGVQEAPCGKEDPWDAERRQAEEEGVGMMQGMSRAEVK